MKPLKHSKYRNTGILFELLVRQVASDTMQGVESKALPIMRKYFAKDTELSKELQLYRTLATENLKSESRSDMLIDTVIKARKQLNSSTLNRQKYNLTKEIQSTYNMDEFFKTNVGNYKLCAATYKLFEYKDTDNPADMVKSRICIVEHLTKKTVGKIKENSHLMEEFSKKPASVRLKISEVLVDKFNEKYGTLNTDQRNLMREYINNISNTGNLKEYIGVEIGRIRKAIDLSMKKIDDEIVKIKINETMKLLKPIEESKKVRDSDILGILRFQELVHELHKVTKGSK